MFLLHNGNCILYFDLGFKEQLIFTQEIPPGGALSGLGRGGAAGERGQGRGRGFFDRHRSQVDDEDGVGRREEGGGRGFGRGT